MTRVRSLVAGSAALLLLAVPAAQAQQATTPGNPPATTMPPADADDPCEVVPGDRTGATQPEKPAQDKAGAGGSSLSATLDRCGGVLSPPAVGDPGMVEPAPDAGVTPVIPPSALPKDE